MVDWIIVTLWYIFVAIATGMFLMFITFIWFCFWTFFVWNEYMKMDDNNLEKEGNLDEKNN